MPARRCLGPRGCSAWPATGPTPGGPSTSISTSQPASPRPSSTLFQKFENYGPPQNGFVVLTSSPYQAFSSVNKMALLAMGIRKDLHWIWFPPRPRLTSAFRFAPAHSPTRPPTLAASMKLCRSTVPLGVAIMSTRRRHPALRRDDGAFASGTDRDHFAKRCRS